MAKSGEGAKWVDRLIADRYRIVRFVAAGGMGEVYEARDTVLPSRVALKTLLDAQSAAARERFDREVRNAKKVSHPYIATVHDLVEEDGVPFVVMEYVDGEGLDVHLEKRGKLSAKEAIKIILEVTEALAAIHEANLVHRDLKPANIMIRSDGHVKVTDFGLSRRANETDVVVNGFGVSQQTTRHGIRSEAITTITESGAIVGTLNYLSPEQVNPTKPADGKADLFALGIVLLELMTGAAPFRRDGENALEKTLHTMDAIVSEPPRGLEQLRKDPELAELCSLIDDLLAKEPSSRPAETSQVVARLSTLQENLSQSSDRLARSGSEASNITVTEQASSARRRLAAAVGALGLVTLLGLALNLGRLTTTPEPPAGIRDLLVRAELQITDQRWERARPILEGAIKSNPEYLPARARLIEVLDEMGHNTEASRLVAESDVDWGENDQGTLLMRTVRHRLLYQFDEEIALCRRIVRNEDDFRHQLRLIGALVRANRNDDAKIAVAEALINHRGEARLHLEQAHLLTDDADFEGALQSVARAEVIAERLGAEAVIAESTLIRGRIALKRDDLEVARQLLGGALQQFASAGSAVRAAETESYLASVDVLSGDLDDAIERYRRSARVAQEVGHRRLLVSIQSAHGSLLSALGRDAEAEKLLRQAISDASNPLNRELVVAPMIAFSELLLFTERLEEARRYANDALTGAESTGQARLAVMAQIRLANADYMQGNLVAAQTTYAEIVAQNSDREDQQGNVVYALEAEALLLLTIGRPRAALDSANQAISISRKRGFGLKLAYQLIVQASALTALGRDTATASLDAAARASDGIPDLTARVALGRSVVARMNGELEDAARHLALAESLVDEAPDIRISVLIERSRVERERGNPRAAVRAARNAVELATADLLPVARVTLAEALAAAGEYEKATSIARAVLETETEQRLVVVRAAAALVSHPDTTEARQLVRLRRLGNDQLRAYVDDIPHDERHLVQAQRWYVSMNDALSNATGPDDGD